MEDDITLIKYGTDGKGDTIDLDVPLPGAFSGNRIVILEGLEGVEWTETAKALGTPVEEDCDCEQDDEGEWVIPNVGRFVETWFDKLTAQNSIKGIIPSSEDLLENEFVSIVETVKVSIRDAVQAFIKSNPNIKDWPGKIDIPIPTTDEIYNTTVTPIQTIIPYQTILSNQAVNVADRSFTISTFGISLINLFKKSISRIGDGLLDIPVPLWGGGTKMATLNLNKSMQQRFIPVSLPLQPAAELASSTDQCKLFIVQVIGISSFLSDYGLGKTVKTFTLLPGEETKISTKTWKSYSTTITESSSVIDSYSTSSSETFATTMKEETSETLTESESGAWEVEAEVSGSWGVAKASASGSKSGESSSSMEEFASSVNEVVTDNVTTANSNRENTVTSSSEATMETGEETVTERTIKNINVKRTLNFVFRELNQLYQTKIHLKDIRIAFHNGNPGSWYEVPLSGLAGFLDLLIKSGRELAADRILSEIDVFFDYKDDAVSPIEVINMNKCGNEKDGDPELISVKQDKETCIYDAPPSTMSWYYHMKRGPLNQEGEEEIKHQVDGILLKVSDQVLRTDSVIVEALLGTNDALDQYSTDLQEETIRQKKLANDREELAQSIVNSGNTAQAEIYNKLFVIPESEAE